MKKHNHRSNLFILMALIAMNVAVIGSAVAQQAPAPAPIPAQPVPEPSPEAFAKIQPEIDIPEDWVPIEIPENIDKEHTRGILKGGASPDRKKGVILSILNINPEKFKEMENPLEQLAFIIKEGDKKSGFNPTAEREVQTTLGKARVVTSQSPEGTMQTWVLIHGKTGVFLKLFTYNLGEASPSEDEELKKILKSLKLPPLPSE